MGLPPEPGIDAHRRGGGAVVTALATTASAAAADVTTSMVPDLSYATAIHNNGPDPATGGSLVVTLPGGVIPISVSGPCAFNAPGTQVSCALGPIPSGTTATITVVLHAITVGVKTATATATAAEIEPTPGDNTHSASVTVTEVGISEVQVTLDDGPDPLSVGQTLTYTAVVTNNFDDDAQDVLLSVVLPKGVTFSSASSDRGRCGHIGRLVTCKLGSFAVTASSTATIKVVPKSPVICRGRRGPASRPSELRQQQRRREDLRTRHHERVLKDDVLFFQRLLRAESLALDEWGPNRVAAAGSPVEIRNASRTFDVRSRHITTLALVAAPGATRAPGQFRRDRASSRARAPARQDGAAATGCRAP
jgi:uncharacterized repeat protein (TIGR01451 family)